MKKSLLSIVLFLAVLVGCSETQRHHQNLDKKEIFLCFFNQSAYNKQWLGGGTSNIARILVLTTTSTIKRSRGLG
jgi:hypothetical protein